MSYIKGRYHKRCVLSEKCLNSINPTRYKASDRLLSDCSSIMHKLLDYPGRQKIPEVSKSNLLETSKVVWDAKFQQAIDAEAKHDPIIKTNWHFQDNFDDDFVKIIMNMGVSDVISTLDLNIEDRQEQNFTSLYGDFHERINAQIDEYVTTVYYYSTAMRYAMLITYTGNYLTDKEAIFSFASRMSSVVKEYVYSTMQDGSVQRKKGENFISSGLILNSIQTVDSYVEYLIEKLEYETKTGLQNDGLTSFVVLHGNHKKRVLKLANTVQSISKEEYEIWDNTIVPQGYRVNVGGVVVGVIIAIIIIALIVVVLLLSYLRVLINNVIDITSALTLLLAILSLIITLFKAIYTTNWSLHDMIRGYVIVKEWVLLPQKLRTKSMLLSFIKFILMNPDRGAMLDESSCCYFKFIAQGTVQGPGVCSTSHLIDAGFLIIKTNGGNLLLAYPSLSESRREVLLRAEPGPLGRYHVVGMSGIDMDIRPMDSVENIGVKD